MEKNKEYIPPLACEENRICDPANFSSQNHTHQAHTNQSMSEVLFFLSRLTVTVAAFIILFALTPALAMNGINTSMTNTDKDVEVMIRVIHFTDKAPVGTVNVGIIYDESNNISSSSAENVYQAMRQNKGARNIKLRPAKISLSDINESDIKTPDLSRYNVFYLTENLVPHYDRLKTVLSGQKNKLVISKDPACLQNNICVMHFDTRSLLWMKLNAQLARKRHVAFNPGLVALLND